MTNIRLFYRPVAGVDSPVLREYQHRDGVTVHYERS